jgi:hypothetical protein
MNELRQEIVNYLASRSEEKAAEMRVASDEEVIRYAARYFAGLNYIDSIP